MSETDSKEKVRFHFDSEMCTDGEPHKWDGPMVTFECANGAGGGSVTCSKCGKDAMSHDMMYAP